MPNPCFTCSCKSDSECDHCYLFLEVDCIHEIVFPVFMIRQTRTAFQPSSPKFRQLRETDRWLFDVLSRFGCINIPKRRNVLVVGSTQPWHEGMLLNACPAALVHTIDYNKLTYEHERLSTSTVNEWLERQLDPKLHQKYDFIIAVLAIEHDGLG